MNIVGKCILHFLRGLTISLLLMTETFATTEFYLFPEDVEQSINCDYLEIQKKQVLCTQNNLLITYDLSRIKKIDVSHEGKSYHMQSLTQEAITRVNDINSNKIGSKQEIQKRAKYSSWMPDVVQQISFASFPDFVQSLKNQYGRLVGNNTLDKILFVSGMLLFLTGSFGFIIATFRIGVIWGLSCMFLPFVSFVFLFVHWRVAKKPFFISILGMAIVFSGALLGTSGGVNLQVTNSRQSAQTAQKNNGQYKCSGKIYCSEMTSCAEAIFYLQSCPGTKMDGDNDGVPCEKQWCGK